MPMTTYTRFYEWTEDEDINEMLKSVRVHYKDPEFIFVDTSKVLDRPKKLFRKALVSDGYDVMFHICCNEYQVVQVGNRTKDSVISYLFGLLHGLEETSTTKNRNN